MDRRYMKTWIDMLYYKDRTVVPLITHRRNNCCIPDLVLKGFPVGHYRSACPARHWVSMSVCSEDPYHDTKRHLNITWRSGPRMQGHSFKLENHKHSKRIWTSRVFEGWITERFPNSSRCKWFFRDLIALSLFFGKKLGIQLNVICMYWVFDNLNRYFIYLSK